MPFWSKSKTDSAVQAMLDRSLEEATRTILIAATVTFVGGYFALRSALPAEAPVNQWGFAMLVIMLVRVISFVSGWIKPTGKIYLLLVALSGGVWGTFPLFQGYSDSLAASMIIFMFPMALAIGSIASFAFRPTLFVVYGLATQLPAVGAVIYFQLPGAFWLSSCLLVFIGTQISLAFGYHRRMVESLALQQSNDQLLRNLSANNAELEKARDAAEAASLAKSEFLARMSHEIRTPMNGVLGTTQLLMRTPMSQQQLALTGTLHGTGRVLLSLLDNLLDISQIESGAITLAEAPFSLNETLVHALQAGRVVAASKSLTFEVDVASDVPEMVHGDAVRLHQIVGNLVDNAVKFTSRGGVQIKIYSQPADGQEAAIRLQIIDTGIGIAKGQLSTVYETFQQADGTSTRQFGGVGLGLSIVLQLVELMAGTIDIQSEKDVGTQVQVWLPLALCEAQDYDTAVALPGVALSQNDGVPDEFADTADVGTVGTSTAGAFERRLTESQGRQAAADSPTDLCRVLVVEDNAVNQMVIEAMLDGYGCEVDMASNGEEGVASMDYREYDIVFMDCQMPVLDGYSATQRIRSSGVQTPIVAVTANAMPEDRQRCLDAGMNDYVRKPLDSSDLEAMLVKWAGYDASLVRSDAA